MYAGKSVFLNCSNYYDLIFLITCYRYRYTSMVSSDAALATSADSVTDTEHVPNSQPASSDPLRSVQLTRFAIHALTGWAVGQLQPLNSVTTLTQVNEDSNAADDIIPDDTRFNEERLKAFLDEVIAGGAFSLNSANDSGPPFDPLAATKLPSAALSSEQVTGEADASTGADVHTDTAMRGQFTKRQYDTLFRLRREEHAEQARVIDERNAKIEAIQSHLTTSLHDVYTLWIPSLSTIVPVLGIYPGDNVSDILDTRLLVSWSIEGAKEASVHAPMDQAVPLTSGDPVSDPFAKFLPPLPQQTAVSTRYLTLRQLLDVDASFFRIVKTDALPYHCALSHPWRPTVPVKEDKAAAKAVKGKPAASDHTYEPVGPLPSTLLHLDLSAFSTADSNQEDRHIKLSIAVQCDLVKPLHPSDIQHRVDLDSKTCSISLRPIRTTPFLADQSDGLVYEHKLDIGQQIALDEHTFSIPLSQLLGSTGGTYALLSLDLQSQASLHFSFACNVPVAVDSVEKAVAKLGLHVVSFSGTANVTPQDTDQLLFRYQLPKAVDAGCTGADSGLAEDMSQTSNHSAIYYPFIDLSSSAAESQVSLSVVSSIADQDTPFSRTSIHNKRGYESTSTDDYYLVGMISSKGVTCSIPASTWSFSMLSSLPLPVTAHQIPLYSPLALRYRGEYAPNNKQLLFKDVLSVDKASFPLAIQLSLSSIATEAFENAQLVLTVYLRPTMTVLQRVYGSIVGGLECLSIPLPLTEVAASGMPDKHKASTSTLPSASVELLFECQIVPTSSSSSSYYSPYPYSFAATLPHDAEHVSPTDLPRPATLFKWTLDFLSGRVLSVAPDNTEAERFQRVKASWAKEDQHRHKKADLARQFFNNHQQANPQDDAANLKMLSEILGRPVAELEELLPFFTSIGTPSSSPQPEGHNSDTQDPPQSVEDALQKFNQHNASLRAEAVATCDRILLDMKGARTEAVAAWKAREAFRTGQGKV